MATTNMVYTNPQKQSTSKIDNSNRFKINEKMLAIMAKNPTLGIGYVIGSMLGDNYFGKKRNKSAETAATDAYNQLYGNGNVPTQQNGSVDWDKANQILEAYAGANNAMKTPSVANAMNQQRGWVASPGQGVSVSANPAPVPQTPQQANAPAITLDNAGSLGGMTTMQDMWNKMQNNGTYNNGNTGLYTNGARDLNNVVTAGDTGPRQVPGFEAYLEQGITNDPAQAKLMAKRAQELENMRWEALNQVGQNPLTNPYFSK